MSEILQENFNISTEDGLKKVADEFVAYSKFGGITFDNSTGYWEVGQVFYEGWDKNGGYPPGFSGRTGVTVGGVNVMPNRQSVSNVQSQVKVQANFVECGLTNLVHQRTGRRISQFKLRDQKAPEGKFFLRAYFGIKDRNKSNEDDSFEIRAEYLLNTGETIIEYIQPE